MQQNQPPGDKCTPQPCTDRPLVPPRADTGSPKVAALGPAPGSSLGPHSPREGVFLRGLLSSPAPRPCDWQGRADPGVSLTSVSVSVQVDPVFTREVKAKVER